MASAANVQMAEQLISYAKNLRWAKAHSDDLAEYEGKYVAVSDGKVVDSSTTAAALDRKYKGTPGIYVGFVAKIGSKWVL
jgi:Family of unknown function (DUF5678)